MYHSIPSLTLLPLVTPGVSHIYIVLASSFRLSVFAGRGVGLSNQRNVLLKKSNSLFVLKKPTATSKAGVLVLFLCYILQEQYCNFKKIDHFFVSLMKFSSHPRVIFVDVR